MHACQSFYARPWKILFLCLWFTVPSARISIFLQTSTCRSYRSRCHQENLPGIVFFCVAKQLQLHGTMLFKKRKCPCGDERGREKEKQRERVGTRVDSQPLWQSVDLILYPLGEHFPGMGNCCPLQAGQPLEVSQLPCFSG